MSDFSGLPDIQYDDEYCMRQKGSNVPEMIRRYIGALPFFDIRTRVPGLFTESLSSAPRKMLFQNADKTFQSFSVIPGEATRLWAVNVHHSEDFTAAGVDRHYDL